MRFSSPFEGALEMFHRGFAVFPLLKNTKQPAVKWRKWAATATEEDIRGYHARRPDCNWGVALQEGKVAIDVDNKKGKHGGKNLQALEDKFGVLPETFTVKTPSGGFHLYFQGDGSNTASSLAPGVDTRAVGGFLVCPGSKIDGEPYTIVHDDAVASLPLWVSKRLKEARKEKDVLETGILVEEGKRDTTLTSIAGTMRSRGLSFEAIRAALLVVNEQQLAEPLPEWQVEKIASSIAAYEPRVATTAAEFVSETEIATTRGSEIPFDAIPARRWIMKNRFISGFISVIASPGGTGKSTLTLLDAIAIASGESYSGFRVEEPGGVWVYNTEDPIEEIHRRVYALVLEHGLPPSVLENIHLSSGRDNPLTLAKLAPHEGVVINDSAINTVIEYIRQHNIKVFIADPFVRTHAVNENDNMQIDKVLWAFQKIATATGCAVGLVHHTSQAASNLRPDDPNAARGATALINAARIAHNMSVLSERDAPKFGVKEKERKWFVRLDNAKANLQPPAESAVWFRRGSVILPNGDSVGTLGRISLLPVVEVEKKTAGLAEFLDSCSSKEIPAETAYEAIEWEGSLTDFMSVCRAAKTIEGYSVIEYPSDGGMFFVRQDP